MSHLQNSLLKEILNTLKRMKLAVFIFPFIHFKVNDYRNVINEIPYGTSIFNPREHKVCNKSGVDY